MDNSQETYHPEEIETGRRLFLGSCDFMLSAASSGQIPETQVNDVAFLGRSNVGKSSLINALTNRKTLARTSNTPGRTQQINFFNLGDSLCLVDLPGYGYAQAPKENIKDWNRLIHHYLSTRQHLKRVMMLIDSRHGIKKIDEEMFTYLDSLAVSYQIVLTKTDQKKKQDQSIETMHDILRRHAAAHPHILSTSSKRGNGIETLRTSIAKLI